MSFDIGKQRINEKCPNCGRSLRFSLNDLSSGRRQRCTCGLEIVGDPSVRRVVNDVNKAFKDLERQLKRLGR